MSFRHRPMKPGKSLQNRRLPGFPASEESWRPSEGRSSLHGALSRFFRKGHFWEKLDGWHRWDGCQSPPPKKHKNAKLPKPQNDWSKGKNAKVSFVDGKKYIFVGRTNAKMQNHPGNTRQKAQGPKPAQRATSNEHRATGKRLSFSTWARGWVSWMPKKQNCAHRQKYKTVPSHKCKSIFVDGERVFAKGGGFQKYKSVFVDGKMPLQKGKVSGFRLDPLYTSTENEKQRNGQPAQNERMVNGSEGLCSLVFCRYSSCVDDRLYGRNGVKKRFLRTRYVPKVRT